MTEKNYLIAKRYLPGDKLYKKYWEMGGYNTLGNIKKLQKWCLTQQIVNPNTMLVPKVMGIWKSMWRWAVKHKDEAYQIAQAGGDTMSLEEWNDLMIKFNRTANQSPKATREYKLHIMDTTNAS